MFCIVILWSQRHALAVSGGEHRIKTNRDATPQPRPCGQSKTSLSHAAVPAGPRPPRPHRTVPGTHARPDTTPPPPPGRGKSGGRGRRETGHLDAPPTPPLSASLFLPWGRFLTQAGEGGGGEKREGRGGGGKEVGWGGGGRSSQSAGNEKQIWTD